MALSKLNPLWPVRRDYRNLGEPLPECQGLVVCLSCPRPWHDPPYLSFPMPHHLRYHLRQSPDHYLATWCLVHLGFEEVSVVMSAFNQPLLPSDPLIVRISRDGKLSREAVEAAIDYRQGTVLDLTNEIVALEMLLASLPEDGEGS